MKERDDYQALLSHMSDCVVAVNRDFQIIMSNERFQSEFGVHPDGICYEVWRGRFKDGKWHHRLIVSVTREAFEALQHNGFRTQTMCLS